MLKKRCELFKGNLLTLSCLKSYTENFLHNKKDYTNETANLFDQLCISLLRRYSTSAYLQIDEKDEQCHKKASLQAKGNQKIKVIKHEMAGKGRSKYYLCTVDNDKSNKLEGKIKLIDAKKKKKR